MRDLYEVLRRKEAELARLQKEVEAIRITARVLEEETREPAGPLDDIVIAPPPATVNAGAPPTGAGNKPVEGMYSAAWGNSLKEFP